MFLLSCAGFYFPTIGMGMWIRLQYLVFFTNLSIFLCMIIYGCLVISTTKGIKNGGEQNNVTKFIMFFKGTVIVMLTFTMLVFHFFFARTSFVISFFTLNPSLLLKTGNILLHYAIPLLCLIDWLLFDKKNSFKWFYPIFWLSVPILYFIFVFLRAELGGQIYGSDSLYPYYFLNIHALGFVIVSHYLIQFVITFVVLGYIFVLIDKVLGKIKIPLLMRYECT